MKYTTRENKDGTHTLMRHGEPATNPRLNNAELEFWFRIQELEAEVKKLKATQVKREVISCDSDPMESWTFDQDEFY